MSDTNPKPHQPERYTFWNRSDRSALTVLLGVCGCGLIYLSATHTAALDCPPTVNPDKVKLILEKIDPNTASLASLRRLSMIGPVKAEAIVAYRQAGHVFTSAEDLQNVSGIGPATVKRIRKHLVFSGKLP